MSVRPWEAGPREILQHALALLQDDSDKNRRLAFLSIDNAVELTAKTLLGLPRRITGISISRKDFADASESFPKLLDALENHAGEKLDGVDLGEIEWFHRLRNQLYHQGNGLTVDRDKVEIYAELAKLLFQNLFDAELDLPSDRGYERVGRFLSAWNILERNLNELWREKVSAEDEPGAMRSALSATRVLLALQRMALVDEQTGSRISQMRNVRNDVVHGQVNHAEVLTDSLFDELESLSKKFQTLLDD